MAAVTVTPTRARRPGPTRRGRGRSARSLTPGSGLGLGVGMVWFSLLVLLPLSAIIVEGAGGGLHTYTELLQNKQTRSALTLTVTVSLVTTALNMVMGTLIAWVLVRDRFRGKAVLDLVIDIPFAMPTIVAGLVLLALYGSNGVFGLGVENTQKGVYLAIAFVTLPFVVRTVQPVLEELDSDVEDAAAALGASRYVTFRRVILPALVPAIFAGAALSFARGISEYGSLVLLSGNLPQKTEVVSYRMASLLEGSDRQGAAALASIMLLIAVAAIVVLDLLQRRLARRG
jgi:sulfate transport system permease protein